MFAEKIKVLKNLYDTNDFRDLSEEEDIVTQDSLPDPYINEGEELTKSGSEKIYTIYKSKEDVAIYLTEKSYQTWLNKNVFKEVE